MLDVCDVPQCTASVLDERLHRITPP